MPTLSGWWPRCTVGGASAGTCQFRPTVKRSCRFPKRRFPRKRRRLRLWIPADRWEMHGDSLAWTRLLGRGAGQGQSAHYSFLARSGRLERQLRGRKVDDWSALGTAANESPGACVEVQVRYNAIRNSKILWEVRVRLEKGGHHLRRRGRTVR